MSYFPLPSSSAVESVNGQTGVVTLSGEDVPPILPGDITRVGAGDVLIGSVGQSGNTPYGEVIVEASAVAFSVAMRSTNGRLAVGTPATDGFAAPLSTVKNASTSKPEIVALTGASTAADIVAALKAPFTP